MKSFKLNMLAASALLAAGAVSAQDIPKFEIYGVVGAGIVSADGFGSGTNKSWNGYADQLHSSNRLGFRGGKDVGDGMSIKYMLETNFATATGATGKDTGGNGVEGNTGPFFDREANVTLANKEYGQIALGRGKNFLYNVLDEFDSRGNWNLGGLKPIARYAGFYSGSGVSRFDRMVRYTSPSLNNFKVDVSKSFGNTVSSTSAGAASTTDGWSSASKSSQNIGLRYTNDGLDIAYTKETVRGSYNVGNLPTEKINLLAVKYQLTPQVLVNYGNAITKNPSATTGTTPGGTSSTAFGTAATAAVNNKTTANTNFYGLVYRHSEKLSFNYGNYAVTDRVTGGIDNVTMNSLGAVYTISKGLDINLDYIRATRKSNAVSSFTIFDRLLPDGSAVSESKVSQNAFAVGMQYRW